MNDWISVEERLPLKELEEHNKNSIDDFEVIVKIKEAIFPTTLYFDRNGFYDEHSEYYNVTHWMPIPDFSEGITVISEEKREPKVKENPNPGYVPYLDRSTNIPKLRPCLANGEKGWFHKWITQNKFIFSCNDLCTTAIVELEDGQCKEFNPEQIKFTDRSTEND